MQHLQKRIGYTFKNERLLKQALTHASLTSDIHQNYERLEFLGDRILGLTIAEELCRLFKDDPEGNLSQRFVQLVCKDAVASVMRELKVGKCLFVGNEEVREKANVLCDVGEAIIAAVYLDSGDINKAKEFVLTRWRTLIDSCVNPEKDAKTLLQEEAAARRLPQPRYMMLGKKGPEHLPVFEVRVMLGESHHAVARGKSKKSAEQAAAAVLLEKIRGKDVG